MHKSVTFITASALIILLTAGCMKTMEPASKQKPICFEAGSMLLRDDTPTRAGVLKDDFTDGDGFSVFALRNNDASAPVFNGTSVGRSAGDWSYSPTRYWGWTRNTDYYDFIGFYPSSGSPTRVSGPRLTVTAPYTLPSDNYDLMMAVAHRDGTQADRTSTVQMSFQHMLAAVRVKVINESEVKRLSLKSFCYSNLVTSARAKATLTDPQFSWIDIERSSAAVGGVTLSPAVELAPSDSRTEAFELMIPQRLDDTQPARLTVVFTPQGGSETTRVIDLKDVQKADTTPITRWERGVKYTYEIRIRLDGGVLVTLITTEWDAVDAETPGILIP